MRTATAIAIVFLVQVFVESASAATWVYCSAARDQELAVYQLDEQSGELTLVQRVKTPGEPGALTLSPDRTRLFVALRSAGKLTSFQIDSSNGRLSARNVVEAGADPAQISTDRTGRYLLTAYYVAGKVSVHRIEDDGSLSELPHQELATDRRAHAIVPDAGNRFVFVPHTGPNAIFQFTWNAEAGQLSPHAMPKLQRPPKTGPRHLAWHPRRPWAYINNEQGGSVTAYRLGESGALEPGETVSTLPADFSGSNSTAEIKVHPNGRLLYVANRGHDSLALFQIDESGARLTPLGHELTERTPRSFDIDERGRYLFAAGEASGNLAIYRIDASTGRLARLQTYPVGPMLWWVQACSSG